MFESFIIIYTTLFAYFNIWQQKTLSFLIPRVHEATDKFPHIIIGLFLLSALILLCAISAVMIKTNQSKPVTSAEQFY